MGDLDTGQEIAQRVKEKEEKQEPREDQEQEEEQQVATKEEDQKGSKEEESTEARQEERQRKEEKEQEREEKGAVLFAEEITTHATAPRDNPMFILLTIKAEISRLQISLQHTNIHHLRHHIQLHVETTPRRLLLSFSLPEIHPM